MNAELQDRRDEAGVGDGAKRVACPPEPQRRRECAGWPALCLAWTGFSHETCTEGNEGNAGMRLTDDLEQKEIRGHLRHPRSNHDSVTMIL